MSGPKFSGTVTLTFEGVDLENADIYDEDELNKALADPSELATIMDFHEGGTIICNKIQITEFSEAPDSEED